jgi:hypothetical protein
VREVGVRLGGDLAGIGPTDRQDLHVFAFNEAESASADVDLDLFAKDELGHLGVGEASCQIHHLLARAAG